MFLFSFLFFVFIFFSSAATFATGPTGPTGPTGLQYNTLTSTVQPPSFLPVEISKPRQERNLKQPVPLQRNWLVIAKFLNSEKKRLVAADS